MCPLHFLFDQKCSRPVINIDSDPKDAMIRNLQVRILDFVYKLTKYFLFLHCLFLERDQVTAKPAEGLIISFSHLTLALSLQHCFL